MKFLLDWLIRRFVNESAKRAFGFFVIVILDNVFSILKTLPVSLFFLKKRFGVNAFFFFFSFNRNINI